MPSISHDYQAQMAELVDALVSNTNAARRAGSIPALGTEAGKESFLSPLFFCSRNSLV